MRNVLLFSHFVLLVLTAACSSVNRTEMRTAEDVATLGDRAEVVAVNDVPIRGRVTAHDGVLFLDDDGSATRLDRRDIVTANVSYHVGDIVPGEGMVRRRSTEPLVVAGGSTLGLGATLAAIGAVGVATYHSPPNSFIDFPPFGYVLLMTIVGPALSAIGVALLTIGAIGHAAVDAPQPVVSFVPWASPMGGGGSLAWRF